MKKQKYPISIKRRSLLPTGALIQIADDSMREYSENKIFNYIRSDTELTRIWNEMPLPGRRSIMEIVRSIAKERLVECLETADDLVKNEKEKNPYDRYTIVTDQVVIDQKTISYVGRIICTRFCCGVQFVKKRENFDKEEDLWNWVSTEQNKLQQAAICQFLSSYDKWYLFIFDHALDGTIINKKFYEDIYKISVGMFDNDEDEKLSRRAFLHRCRKMRHWKILKNRSGDTEESYILADGINTNLNDF